MNNQILEEAKIISKILENSPKIDKKRINIEEFKQKQKKVIAALQTSITFYSTEECFFLT